jgi:rhodanese-related sulfurtransferase
VNEPVVAGAEGLALEAGSAPVPERIEIAEVGELLARGKPLAVLDVRSERNYEAADTQASAAVRLPPDGSARAARAMDLPRDVPLIAYCA